MTYATSFARAFAAAALIGGLVAALPSGVLAASSKSSAAENESSDRNSGVGEITWSGKRGQKGEGNMSPQERVENRIKNLHDKLKITPEQESAWNDVAQTMRDNEEKMHELVKARHEEAKSMSAPEDLESYEKIAEAHANGIKKMASAFQSLYDDMSPEQKKNADSVFDRFEGRGMKAASMEPGKNKKSQPAPSDNE
ncbi:MAG: Spy/CpxP family protein refolding chaperone [Bdellovibrionales bacterium]